MNVVYTAWAYNLNFIILILSLNLTGAFDRVSHDRLLWILRKKGFLKWVVSFINRFLTDRKTRLAFSGFISKAITTQTGIP